MASQATDVGSTDPPIKVAIPEVQYTSAAPGQAAARNVVRFATDVDDVKATPLFAGLDGDGVRVAVIDTGIDVDHPALAGRVDMAASRNFSPSEPTLGAADIADVDGHGTHVAGIIGAQDTGAVMCGIAPKATLVVLKVFHQDDTELGAVTRAIRHAIEQRVDVINLSLGIPVDQTAYERFNWYTAQQYTALQDALSAGIIVVASAGNRGVQYVDGRELRSTLNEINPPGSFGGLITVASHDDAGRRSTFSSMGGELDLMAPGEVYSTWPRGVPYRRRPGRDYEHLTGTSMAAPLVAGLAALLVQAGRAGANRQGLSPRLARRLRDTNFRALNTYEVRETLRFLADRPHGHSREDGYGPLSAVYRLVKTTVAEERDRKSVV